MRLRRVRLENVRGVDACQVAFREDGVTIVEAPNESGKTTLIDAVDVLFSEKDTSGKKHVKTFQPVGRDVGSIVEVELTCGGTHLTCRKTFNRQSQTTLHIHSPRPEQLAGTEAHDRLRQILESDVDMALYEALRMSQGRNLDAISLGGSDVLSARLDAAAGGSGTSGGDALLQRAKDVYETYYTEKTGNPKKALTNLDDEVGKLESARDELDAKLKALQADVDQFEVLERNLPTLERRMKEELEPAVARQEKLLGRVRSVQERYATRVAERDNAATRLEAAERASNERAGASKQLTELEAEIQKLSDELKPVQEQLKERKAEQEKQNKSLVEADEAVRDARRQYEVQGRTVELITARRERDRLRATNKLVQKINEDAAEAQRALARTILNDSLFEEIRAADEELRGAHKVLSAGAPVVRLHASRELDIELDGDKRSVEPGAEVEEPIADSLALQVPGVLDLEVHAGTSASELQRRVNDAESRLVDVCERAEVSDLSEAKKVMETRRQHETTLEDRDKQLAQHLEGGSPADLAQRLSEAQDSVDLLAERIPEDVELPDLSTARERLENASKAYKTAEIVASEARKTRDASAETLRIQSEAASKNSVILETREKDVPQLRDHLEEARRERPDEELKESVDKAAEAHRLAEAALNEVQAELDELEPETVELDAEAARTARDNAATRIRELREERIRLESSLQTAGAQGLGERLEEAEAGLERAGSEQRRQWARARAARELYVTLREAREEAYREYREPLRKRIAEGARQLYRTDDLDVELDDKLCIVRRTMGGTTLDWDQLSAGAREQLAILTALAAARLAGEDGVPFVLDDALGYTDPARLERLGQLLGRTEGAQVIVLTCVADRFQYVGGASTVRLRPAGERREL